MNAPYYPPPRRSNAGLWIALAVITVLVVVCLCAAAAGLIFLWPAFSERATAVVDRNLTPPDAIVPQVHTPTPTHLPPLPPRDTPTPTPAPPPPSQDTPTPIADLASFVPDLSGIVSARFSFSRMDGTSLVEGTGQILWPEGSVYEIGDSLFLAEEGEIRIWSDDKDGWVEVLPSARLHDNMAYWLHLLPFATPTSVVVEEEGTIFGFFTLEVPQEQNIFGVRDLHGSGWYRWDPVSGTLRELAYDLVYLDRLGTSINEMRYMQFESWGEPVVIPER